MLTQSDRLCSGHRYRPEIISYAVCLYFRFTLSLSMVEEMLAARGISVTHETIRQWGLKFGREFANRIRQPIGEARAARWLRLREVRRDEHEGEPFGGRQEDELRRVGASMRHY